MRQAATTVTVCFCLVLASSARGGDRASAASDTIDRARRLIDAKDYASAATLLEDLLLEAGARERSVILAVLKQSYEALARQAEAAGRDREAAYYRDNLAILNTSPPARGPARTANANVKPPAKPPSPAITNDLTTQRPEQNRKRDQEKAAIPAPKQAASGRNLEEPAARSEPPIAAAPPVVAEPGASVARSSSDPGREERVPRMRGLGEGDRLFSAKRYEEAGECYAVLARENSLPANRINHWAYCRMVAVATRMNARPQSDREWGEIEAEIQSIQRLAPKLWFGEYLRNRLTEASKSRSRTQTKRDNLVVRASAPDENEGESRRFPRFFGKSRDAMPSRADAETQPASDAIDSKAEGTQQPVNLAPVRAQGRSSPGKRGGAARDDGIAAGAASAAGPLLRSNEPEPGDRSLSPAATPWNGEWQVHETPNFLIFHADSGLAESAAQAAESVRAAQAKRWGSSALQGAWSTRCEIYLYPDGKAFAKATGQPESSPGFSTIESDRKQITTRRVHLRADQPRLVDAVLPHEVTHVVVADLFTAQQIPRWADEGIAVLAEPETEQNLRAADLRESLSSGQVFELRQLMSTDTPEAKDWSLYYAQSVSLTRFLVDQGTPAQLIQFVRESGRKGADAALREVYRIGGFAELQKQWQDYARRQLASIK
jgi:Peptidase MA superfamily